jgi:hypothetical protein
MAKGDWWDPQTYSRGDTSTDKLATALTAGNVTGGASVIFPEIKSLFDKSTSPGSTNANATNQKQDKTDRDIGSSLSGKILGDKLVKGQGDLLDGYGNVNAEGESDLHDQFFKSEKEKSRLNEEFEKRRFSSLRRYRSVQRASAGAGLRSTLLTGSLGLGSPPVGGGLKTLLGQ